MAKKSKQKKGKKKQSKPEKMSLKAYERELAKLEVELVKLQGWIKHKGLKVVVIFEGRDSAGKGGIIKRITRRLNHRIVRVVALGTPTEKEKSQWYFQRYVEQLPSAGEMVLFDRSWYNRSGVEKVMGFCTNKEYKRFMKRCPDFEHALVESGIILVKYWLHITDETQEKRFQQRIHDPRRRWKLSPMDLEARSKWVEYSKARDAQLLGTDTDWAPWYIVDSNVKRHARLNCISHLLSLIPYKDLTPDPIKLPPRQKAKGYKHPDISEFNIVPAVYPKQNN
jgi:polyphosphate kinase 2